MPDEKLIKHLLETGAQVNRIGQHGETALYLISWGGNCNERSWISLVKLLKDKEADDNAENNYGFTPSQWEACSEHSLRKQLQGGFSTSLPDRLGFHEATVRTITNSFWKHDIALFLAAASENEGMLRVMLRSSHHTINSHLHISCILAAHYCHTSCVKLLLKHISEDRWDSEYFFPRAVSVGCADGWAFASTIYPILCRLVPEMKWVNFNLYDSSFGQMLLLNAVSSGREAIVKLLLETNQVDVNSKDRLDRTPLSYAAQIGNQEIVRFLLETNNVDVNSKDRWDSTPLCYAAENGNETIVKLLLGTNNVDVNSKDRWDSTPLCDAAENGNETIVKLLLGTNKVNVNSKDCWDSTPLCYAAQNGHEVIVKMLLETNQVNVNSKDRFGHTPLSYAAENGHEAVVQLLRTYNAV